MRIYEDMENTLHYFYLFQRLQYLYTLHIYTLELLLLGRDHLRESFFCGKPIQTVNFSLFWLGNGVLPDTRTIFQKTSS